MVKFVKAALALSFLQVFAISPLPAQKDPAWDKSAASKWDSSFHRVEIPSSADGKIQKAFLYSSKSKMPKPLIVSLHTWSGDYAQEDPVAKEILARDWNYIHPDFRGVNNTPESMGSPLVISDLEDAIQFALKNTNSEPSEVHIIGVSGGGFATLVAYMNITYPVKSFSAWASISDLEAWYWESVGRKQKYADDILKAVSRDSILNVEEARSRSPLFQEYRGDRRKNAKLYIYEGIHDGYDGSVPITQSINMYNRLVGEIKYGLTSLGKIMPLAVTDSNLVSENEIISLLTKRLNPSYNKQENLFGRNIYLSREYNNISLKIFEGGHEQIPQALGLIPVNEISSLKYNILTLGDSNGEIKDGWVDQLKEMLPGSDIVNISRSGRTIGFDNLGKRDLNALANIDNFLEVAVEKAGGKKYDFIIVCLGTNDTKLEYAERQNEVVANFGELLKKIVNHPLNQKSSPVLIYLTPPPIRDYDILSKYSGANERIGRLITPFTSLAIQNGFQVIDVYHPLLGILDYYAADGVHMAGPGQEIVASKIVDVMERIK